MARPVLVTIRGNSASGKSSVAQGIRAAYGRGLAVVAQDVLRREVLRELPVLGGANIGLIGQVTRYALDHGFHTVVEGILEARVYGAMLTALVEEHRATGGTVRSYYLDVPLEETLRRHAGKPIAAEVGEDQLRRWYLAHDTVPRLGEEVFTGTTSIDETVVTVLQDTRLLDSSLRPLHRSWDAPPGTSATRPVGAI
jgi:predicted kinase